MLVRQGSALDGPAMEVMNFLNEAKSRFPQAISFAAGRPPDQFLSAQPIQRWLSGFVESRSRLQRRTPDQVWSSLGQYSETNGIIQDLITQYLQTEEGIESEPRACMITNGTQEALAIVLLGLAEATDVVLATDPTYVGLTGAAALARVPVQVVPHWLPLLEGVRVALASARARGRRPLVFYVIPDASNPTGESLSLEERQGLLALAREHDFYLLEDAAYRQFHYEGDLLPSLKRLDRDGRVIYLGSFAKLFMPGARIGFLVQGVPPRGRHEPPNETLAERLSRAKSFLSVTTAPITQAALGGFLLEQRFRLADWNRPRLDWCRANRDRMLQSLEKYFGGDVALRDRTRWTRPRGGFFIALSLPFSFGRNEMLVLAQEYGVIVCPMTFFSPSGGFTEQVRLSFSNAEPVDIDTGIRQLHAFVGDTMLCKHAGSQRNSREKSHPHCP
jgi:(S)-3,5-dihydroxyphenylglycine transaminase